MSLEEKVAKLFGDGKLQGTSWLIKPDMAITALHCIQSEDGVAFTNLNLKFYGIEGEFVVDKVEAKILEMDVAILKIKVKNTSPPLPIIQLSRRGAVEGDNCRMRGHPEIAAANHPDGIPVTGRVLQSALPYEKDNIQCHTVCIDKVSVQAQSGTTNLQGISGGPVTIEGDEFSFGVVISEAINGNQIRVISIKDIAAKVDVVKNALENSEHSNPVDKNVYVHFCRTTNKIQWSALFPPKQVGDVWGVNPSYIVSSIICDVPSRYLGKSGRALVRFLAYSNITTCKTLDRSKWTTMLSNLDESDMRPNSLPNVVDYSLLMDKDLVCYPSKWLTYTSDDLANEIHSSLNLQMIENLSESLYGCLCEGKDNHYIVGCEIEASLRIQMWKNWEVWEIALKNDPELLRCYLIRIFSEEGSCDTFDNELLTSIGCSDKVREQLYIATIYSLALSAINISVNPIKDGAGNLAISNGNTGHACGKENKGRTRFDMVVSTITWETNVVILPYIRIPLIQSYASSISMTKPDGTLGTAMKNIPPLGIIGDNDFLSAMTKGVMGVQSYYDKKLVEVSEMIENQELASRTEPLNVSRI